MSGDLVGLHADLTGFYRVFFGDLRLLFNGDFMVI